MKHDPIALRESTTYFDDSPDRAAEFHESLRDFVALKNVRELFALPSHNRFRIDCEQLLRGYAILHAFRKKMY